MNYKKNRWKFQNLGEDLTKIQKKNEKSQPKTTKKCRKLSKYKKLMKIEKKIFFNLAKKCWKMIKIDQNQSKKGKLV